MGFGFLLQSGGKAPGPRAGELFTGGCVVSTPVFMPVGTQGTVKGMRPDDLEELGFRLILANAYHLSLRPGPEPIRKAGGFTSS